MRVTKINDATITVVGLDAIDGFPILDIKPCKPIFDESPISMQEVNKERPIIVLTGGPGGGKSTLLEELAKDPSTATRFVAVPEVVQYARFAGISPREKLFQHLIVKLQWALEDTLQQTLDTSDGRPIVCHRGSLDPLGFWLRNGWPEDEFYLLTSTSREQHYKRYTAVIHLVTAADGAIEHYFRWPNAHRPETAKEAVKLDAWLQQAWSNHPNYHRIDNAECDWEIKSAKAKRILENFLYNKELKKFSF